MMAGQEGEGGAKNSGAPNGEALTNGSNGGSSEDGGKGSMAEVVRGLLARFAEHTQDCGKEFMQPKKVRFVVFF